MEFCSTALYFYMCLTFLAAMVRGPAFHLMMGCNTVWHRLLWVTSRKRGGKFGPRPADLHMMSASIHSWWGSHAQTLGKLSLCSTFAEEHFVFSPLQSREIWSHWIYFSETVSSKRGTEWSLRGDRHIIQRSGCIPGGSHEERSPIKWWRVSFS